MARFNLTFRGEILPGRDPEQARAGLGELLGIDDPERLAKYFCGDLMVLQRNLERKEAAELYARLRQLGMGTELVKIEGRAPARQSPRETAATPVAETPPTSAPSPAATAPQPAPSEPAAAPAQDSSPTRPAATAQQAAKGNGAADQGSQPPLRRADLAARHTLRSEDAAQLKAKERALRKALRAKDREEARRQRAAEQAREKALAREAARRAKLEAERQRAADQARLEAERVAREAERARLAEQARQRQLEQQRQAEEKAAKRAAEKQAREQQEAQARVEAARRKRERADEMARRKAGELRQRAREQARQEAAERERLAQHKAMEQQAAQRAAVELTRSKPAAAGRVRTRMELPSRRRSGGSDPGAERRRRQAGEPNLFSLTPFRNSPQVRARAERSRQSLRLALAVTAIALACALAILLRLLLSPPPATGSSGADALAVSAQQQLVLLAGDQLLLHDRSGVGTAALELADLGLAGLDSPLAFSPDGALLGTGRLAGLAGGNSDTPGSLLRCQLEESSCELFSPALAASTISAVAVHPLDGTVFVADAARGELLKLDAEGELLARATAPLPARPVLRLDSGLLLVNSAEGAAISVFRYEDEAFGQRLDEILLLPPDPDAAPYTGVKDFLRSDDGWWVSVTRGQNRGPALLRFDDQWQFIERVSLPPATRPEELAAWGPRVLVRDHRRLPLQRFDQQGAVQAPLISDLLTGLHKAQQRRAELVELGWRAGLALCTLVLIAGACLGILYRLRTLVYTSSRERGAEPLDQLAGTINWISPAPDRAVRLVRLARAYAVLAAGLVLTAIGLGVSAVQLSALLLALAGPAIALMLVHGSEPGHIGTNGDTLVLADHTGVYHLGGDSRVHYRGPFLMIDDVTVFTGSRWLPAFAPDELAEQVAPLARRGIRVDRKILAVRLLQARHPLALGAAAIAACACGALALLSLPGLT